MGIVYVMLLVACSAGITLSCKWANRKGSSPLGLATVVQLASLVGLAGFSVAWGRAWSWPLVLLGIGAGVGGRVGFLVYLRALEIGHYALTGAICGASFLASVAFSAIFWEHVGVLQVAGIGTLVAAVALLAYSSSPREAGKDGHWGRWIVLVAGAFLLFGLAQVTNAGAVFFFKTRGGLPLLEFMTVIYVTGTLVLLPVNLRMGNVSRRTVLYGSLGAGISLLGTVFNINALRRLPPSVVFPVSVSSGLLVAVLLSHLIFKETMRPLAYLGILLEIAGVVLLAIAMAQA